MRNLPTLSQDTPPADFVPQTLDEMYRSYYIYLLKLVKHNGIDYQNADDVVQKIFEKVISTDMLSDFDPTMTFNDRAAVFKTFLSGFALKYLRHHRHMQNLGKVREPQLVDRTVGNTGSNEGANGGMSWVDVYGPTFEEEYEELHEGEFLERVRVQLRQARPKRKDSQLDLVVFFDEIARQVALDGTYSTTTLMAVFGKTRTTIHNWLNELRAEIAKGDFDGI